MGLAVANNATMKTKTEVLKKLKDTKSGDAVSFKCSFGHDVVVENITNNSVAFAIGNALFPSAEAAAVVVVGIMNWN